MNAVVEMKPGIVPSAGRLSVTEVTQHAIAVQEVMKAVMKPQVHYGIIPGTDKPTLYKAGAELLCMTFRIADDYRIEEISTPDIIRYRVTCIGRHQMTGVELGSGMGECSTSEEKYRWRKAVCVAEWDETPANMRRVKYIKGGSVKITQVRTEPADLANTVLKMACKRAKMAMVLNVTAASDCFAQDLEDLDDVLREHLADGQQAPKADPGPQPYPAEQFDKNLPAWQKLIAEGKKTPEQIIAAVQSKAPLTEEQRAAISAPPEKTAFAPDDKASAAVVDGIRAKAKEAALSDADVARHLSIDSLDRMSVAQAEQALAFIRDPVGASK